MNISSAILLLFPITCSAQMFQGRVTNGSTGNRQPSSQVILFTPAGEQGRAMTNDRGDFHIDLPAKLAPGSSAVLQVTKDGVDYFQTVRAGEFANLKIYQAAGHVSSIDDQFCILQFQTSGKRLQVTELHALNNRSDPPITQVNSGNFVLSIPPGAQIESAIVSSPDGGTSKLLIAPVAEAANQYRIDFPVKPGLTKYAIRYELNYDARGFVFSRRSQYPMDQVGVMVPNSMRFRSRSPHTFHAATNAGNTQEQQFELDKLEANATFGFTLSGTGELARSFRPLQPSERPAPQTSRVEDRMRSAFTVRDPSIAVHPDSASSNSFFTAHRRAIILGIFFLVAALAAHFTLRAHRKNRNRARLWSTDADLSSHQGLSAPGRLAAQGRRH
ncbi:MAG TPA: hypothetical protein VK722_16370 [Candidatus Aquilonibacter sp.]|jgi:hypothetical protein|nr:hypothetical protein [Candidatus Aquilonibacter sp.]